MGKNSFKSFEELECWKACTEVRRFIIKLVKKYPKEEIIIKSRKIGKRAYSLILENSAMI